MQDSPNPFAPQPDGPPPSGPSHPPGVPPRAGGSGMLGVAPVVCVLMIVLGALELLYALSIGGFQAVEMVLQPSVGSPVNLLGRIVGAIFFGGIGFIGLLRIVAAVGGLKYRGWGTMMTACCLGLASVFTCYCAPFSLVVGILGIVVLSDSHVRRAFEMGQQGASPDDIRRIIGGR